MAVKSMRKNTMGTHKERASDGSLTWGLNGPVRPNSQAYRDNFDAIFNKKPEVQSTETTLKDNLSVDLDVALTEEGRDELSKDLR